MVVLHRPADAHYCRPGWVNVPLPEGSYLRERGYRTQSKPDPETFHAPPGTLWLCSCGRTWVARRNVPGQLFARWERETWLARWWRQRMKGRTRWLGMTG